MYEPKDCKYYNVCEKIRVIKERDGAIKVMWRPETVCNACPENKAGEPPALDAETEKKLQEDLQRQVNRLKRRGKK